MKRPFHKIKIILTILGVLVSFHHTAQVSSSGCYISAALIDPSSTAGCGNTPHYCDLASLYVPAFSPTACGTSVITGGVSHTKATVYTLPAGCTATIEAEFRKRNYLGISSGTNGCSNSGMDGSPDGLTIVQSGGTIINQYSILNVNVGTCGSYPVLGTYTTAVATISPGCSNADGYVYMELTGGTFTVGGTSNRADEVITFTVNLSGTCGPSCSSVLPIELFSFNAEQIQNRIQLTWRVASELNVDYYKVERSNDGDYWDEISVIQSKSKSQGTNVLYETEDRIPKRGVNYYRLVNIDKNGTVGEYKLIVVYFNHEDSNFWIEQDKTNIYVINNLKLNESFQYLFYDSSGHLIESNLLLNVNNKHSIDKANISNGIYCLVLLKDGKSEVIKVYVY